MGKLAGIYGAGDRSWMRQAKCVGKADEVFFPEQGKTAGEAKAICRTCPVREACLEYALVAGERFGIWGGGLGAGTETAPPTRTGWPSGMTAAARRTPLLWG